MAYKEQIQELQNPTFQHILQIAKENCDEELCKNNENGRQVCKPWNKINHGVDLLDSDEKLIQYLCAYGAMHKTKMYSAFDTIKDVNIFDKNCTIIDWGCGQGLATVCFFDFLKEHNIQNNVQNIILIEPSTMALERATLHTNAYLKDENKIKTVNEFLDDVKKSDIATNQSVTLHFFSNILDIQQIDLQKLAKLVGENINGEHYFFCVGPNNAGSNRIDYFYNHFNSPDIISNEEQGEHTLELLAEETNNQRLRSIKLKIFKFEQNKNYFNSAILQISTEKLNSNIPFDFPSQLSKNIYFVIKNILKNETIKISDYKHTNWLEHYTILTENESAIIRVHFNGKNRISRIEKPINSTEFSEHIFDKLKIIQGLRVITRPELEFVFSEPFLQDFYIKLKNILEPLSFQIVNIEHNDWHEVYTIQKDSYFATYKFWYNGKGMFTRPENIQKRTTGLTDEINEILKSII